MTIKEIYRKGEINIRSFNVCIDNKINSLKDLKNFFKVYSTFKKLRNCGNKSNEELIAICKKYYLNKDNIVLEKITLNDLYKKGELNVRSFNVCNDSNIKFLEDLKKFYAKHNSFKKLRNCGNKSNQELISVCKKYHSVNEDFLTPKKKENRLEKIVFELTRIQREVINSFIIINTNSLSNRVRNAVSYQLEDNFKIKRFTEKILLNPKPIETWKNIGTNSIPEIEIYLSIIKDFVFEVSQTNDEIEIIGLKNNFLIQRTFSISNIPNNILETESIFLLTDFLLKQNALFDKTQTTIVKKAFKIYQNQKELTLDDIADDVNLTRERVRQIRKFCIESLFDKLLFIQNFNDDLYKKYNIDIESNQIEISLDIVELINITNETKLTREFTTYILFVFLSKDFSIIGNVEDVLQPHYFNAKNRHNWINFYLIKKEIIEIFDFDSLANDIDKRTNDRIEETYSFNFKSYLSQFLTTNKTEVLNKIFPITENILNNEFELYLDLDENLIFKRNTNKQAYEYSYEALEQLGEPSKVEEIYEKILKLNPNYETNESKVRSSLKRTSGFVPIGRKSVFGLKKWEKELVNFKGGTIRNIVEEFLNNSDNPKHISEITNHVLQFRPKSNQNSIWTNIKLDESGVYSFFKNSKIGLSNKNYNISYIQIREFKRVEKKTWEERYEMIKNFTAKENRLPYSSGCSESEKYLYRWYNLQKRKSNDGKLDKEKKGLIIEIHEKYSQINSKKRTHSSLKYIELIAFIKSNSRLPSANKNGETKLYQFFYKQRKLFDKNKLESKEEIQLIEIAKILQKIKYEN